MDKDKKWHPGWTAAAIVAPWVAIGLVVWDMWDGKFFD
jgi:hypothetical protein